MNYQWHFDVLWQFWPLWIRGVVQTLWISSASICLGTILAIGLTLARRSQIILLRTAAKLYIDFFRALPVFVLLSLIFFVVPILMNVRLTAWNSALLAFSLNLAPFVCECVRAGFDSIPIVQYESAKAIGFSSNQIFRFIIAPQAVQRIIPTLLGEYITTIKLTSLASVIGVEEIWNTGSQMVAQTSLTIEGRLIGALLYILIIMPLIWGLNYLEKRFSLKGVLGTLDPA